MVRDGEWAAGILARKRRRNNNARRSHGGSAVSASDISAPTKEVTVKEEANDLKQKVQIKKEECK